MAVSGRGIFIQAGTQVHASFEQGQNFILDFPAADVVNYSRWGHDLVVHLSSGADVRINDFFARGAGFHQLVLLGGDGRVQVDFSRALDMEGDGIEDALVSVNNAAAGGATNSLRTLLIGGAAAVGAGAAAVIANDSDDAGSSPPAYQFPKPFVLLVDSRITEEGKGWISGVATKETKPHLSGRGVPGATITLRVNDGDPIEIIVKDDGSWSYDFPNALEEGNYKIKISQHDAQGHRSESEFDFTIDTTPPQAPILGWTESDVEPAGKIENGLTNDSRPKFHGKAEAHAKIDIYVEINGKKNIHGSGVADKDGNWSIELTKSLEDGKHKITITATDAAGNVSQATEETLEIDTTPPKPIDIGTVEAYDPDNPDMIIGSGDTTPVQKIAFKGKADSSVAKILIYDNGNPVGEVTQFDADGNWTYSFDKPLEFGHYNFAFEARDAAGNKASWEGQDYSITIEDPAASALSSLSSDAPSLLFGDHDGVFAIADQHYSQDAYLNDPPLPVIF